MNRRDTMKALLAGERLDVTPQWLMAFASTQLAHRLMPVACRYDGYGEYPVEGSYPFSGMGELRLTRQAAFNAHIDRCAFPVGWGANAAFGHAGPGEFNKRVIEKHEDRMVVAYETGAKREIRYTPHNYHTFYLPVGNEDDLMRLELPDPTDPARYRGFAEDIAWAKSHGEWTVGWVNGFFSGVHYFLRPYEEFCADLLLSPDFARAVIATVGNWSLAAARMMCEAGVDCIGFCDDLGSGQSLLLSPAVYREFIWPWHRRLCDLVHAYGAVVHLHSHGAIMPILRDIASAGIDILNPLDPNDHMSMAEVREAVGPTVVLCGGMHTHFFDWSTDEQITHLRAVISEGRKLGPHILMDSGGIPDSVDRPWFDWFCATSRDLRAEQQRYDPGAGRGAAGWNERRIPTDCAADGHSQPTEPIVLCEGGTGEETLVCPTRRSRMQAAFAGIVQSVPPVSIRMDLWHRDAVSRGLLPDEVTGCSVEQIEDRLGFCRSARYRTRPRLVFPEGWVDETDVGGERRTRYHLPGAVLEQIEITTADQARAGMRGTIVKYPVADAAGCRALLDALAQATIAADVDGFAAFDRDVGDAGLPLLILGSCPAHTLMLEWCGYEHFFYAMADCPDLLTHLIDTLALLFRRDLWAPALHTDAELILHGNHFADATTPPPLFRRYFLPYFQAFNAKAHATGKRVLWHADAGMGTLLDLVVDAGFDGADCLATAPLVPQTLEDYDRAWRGRLVCWGGLPSILFDPEFPETEFHDYLRRILALTREKRGFILGASDNVMPGARWDRLRAVGDMVGSALPEKGTP